MGTQRSEGKRRISVVNTRLRRRARIPARNPEIKGSFQTFPRLVERYRRSARRERDARDSKVKLT